MIVRILIFVFILISKIIDACSVKNKKSKITGKN